jgi:hypothetical protein
MELVIDRQRWLRGEGAKHSRLLREQDRRMCCLGFLSIACGLSEDSIEGTSTVEELADNGLELPSVLEQLVDEQGERRMSTRLAGRLMAENDDPRKDEAYRERTIAELMERIGVEVTFIN